MNGSNCSCLHDEGCWVADELNIEKAKVEKLRKAGISVLSLFEIDGEYGLPHKSYYDLQKALADTEAK